MCEQKTRRPDFFIVGAPRCGTTALYSYLRQHPDVFMPEHKEPHFFNTDMASGGAVRELQAYLRLFSGARDHKRVGEASVYYLSSAHAPAAIKEFCPHAQILIMLRNPVDVMYAIHALNVAAWVEECWDFEQALALEDERKRGAHLPTWLTDVSKVLYRDTVDFPRHVQRYFDTFGRDNVHVMIYDDFQRDIAGVFRRACAFLGVDPDLPMEFPVVWANVSFRSRALSKFIRQPPAFVRRLGRVLLGRRFRAAVVDTLWRWNSTRAPRAPMDGALRARLSADLAPDVARLGELLGRDLTHWSTP
jgi:hypothetical protein